MYFQDSWILIILLQLQSGTDLSQFHDMATMLFKYRELQTVQEKRKEETARQKGT